MWRGWKESIAELRRAPPGRRFRRSYRRRRKNGNPSYVAMAVSGVIAVVAIIAGIIFAFWPVIPGFVFVLFGLALLSAQSIRIARALDRVELTGWRLIRRRLRKNDGAP